MRLVKFCIAVFLVASMLASTIPSIASAAHGDRHEHQQQAAHHNHKVGQSDPAAQNKMPCCEKQVEKHCDDGNCKCVDGSCHGTSGKLLGGAGLPLPLPFLVRTSFEYSDVVLISAIAERLKRPPRA